MASPRGGRRRVVWALAAGSAAITASWAGGSDALGPVITVSVDEIIERTNEPIGYVQVPVLSDRGEAAGIWDGETWENGFVLLDVPGPENMEDGAGITVSGDGCVALLAVDSSVIEYKVVDRCGGPPKSSFGEYTSVQNRHATALTFDGRIATFPRSDDEVIWMDLTDGNGDQVPRPDEFDTFRTDYGLDISDNGEIVVTTVTAGPSSSFSLAERTEVSVMGEIPWPVSPGYWSSYATISGDGRWVAFASSAPLTGENDDGPWVFVGDFRSGDLRRVSPEGAAAFQPSISRDGSQVAYSLAPGDCQYNIDEFYPVEWLCQPIGVEVAWSTTPGLRGSIQRETVTPRDHVPRLGFGYEPHLAGNGRWIIWATAIRGSGPRHAYLRSRDAGLTVDAIPFGDVIDGTSSTLTTTVRNTGRTSVWIGSISSTGAPFSPIGVGSGSFRAIGGEACAIGGSLSPGATCTVQVRFDASGSAGSRSGELIVAETGYDALTAAGRLTGSVRAIPPGVPVLQATPTSVNFDRLGVGATSPATTITVENIGTGRGEVATTVTGNHPDDFVLTSNGCNNIDLTPGQRCTFSAAFAPVEEGFRSASVVVSTTGSSATVSLAGDADASSGPGLPALIASPDPADFGTIDVGESSDPITITVTNVGRAGGQVTTGLDGDPSEFFVQTNDCNGTTLEVGTRCTMDVIFFAQADGDRRATLTASSSRTSVDIDLRGAGIASVDLVASPTAVDYGPVKVGFSTPDTTVTITNIGNAAGVLNTVLEGPHTSDFFVRVNNCVNTNLEPGDSCTMDIAMFPRAGGDRTATLVVSSGTAAVAVPLGGQGRFEPELIASPGAVTERGVTIFIGQGFPASQPIVVEIRDLDNTVVEPLDVTPDDDGRFRLPFSPLGALSLGAYVLHVGGIDNVYDTIEEPLVVVLPTFQPQGPTGPAFNTNLLVARG